MNASFWFNDSVETRKKYLSAAKYTVGRVGALVAEELGLPFIYVRASNKNHGKKNLIEGYYNSGQSVVVIEDLISSGKSSLAAVEALRNEDLNVRGLLSIFTYSFEEADKNFKKYNCIKNSEQALTLGLFFSSGNSFVCANIYQ